MALSWGAPRADTPTGAMAPTRREPGGLTQWLLARLAVRRAALAAVARGRQVTAVADALAELAGELEGCDPVTAARLLGHAAELRTISHG